MVRRTLLVLVCALAGPVAHAGEPSARELLNRILDVDPWGLAGAESAARVVVTDRRQSTRVLEYRARSRRYAPRLNMSLVRFGAPADIAGVSFLQIQRQDGDDDRFLYLPELKRSRRISGAMRANSFMSTDFSYADMDQRDLRQAQVRRLSPETVSSFPCWRLELVPAAGTSPYGRMEVWVRKDNQVPLKWQMFSPSGVLLKTLVAREMRRIAGRWFVTQCTMTNHAESRRTDLTIHSLVPRQDIPEDEFTVRNLEKI